MNGLYFCCTIWLVAKQPSL